MSEYKEIPLAPTDPIDDGIVIPDDVIKPDNVSVMATAPAVNETPVEPKEDEKEEEKESESEESEE